MSQGVISFFSLFLFIGLLMADDKAEDPLPDLVEQLAAEKSSVRMTAENTLLEHSSTAMKQVVNAVVAAKTSKDPELRARAEGFLEKLYRRHELGEGLPYHGMKLGWFLENDGKKVSSSVLVLKVEKGSPAEKVEIKSGDVIYQAGKDPLGGFHSRNDLDRLLKGMKQGDEVLLHIKYNDSTDPTDLYHKNKRKKAKLVMGEPVKKKASRIKADLLQRWIDAID